MASGPTNSNDYLTVDAPDTTLDALNGDDTVIVVESGAVAQGGAGDDWLSTNLNVTAGPGADEDDDGAPDSATVDEITTELQGDAGDDHIHASLRAVNYGLFQFDIVAKLTGGDGNDQLWLDAVGSSGQISSKIDGGLGEDDIRVTTMSAGDGWGANGPVRIDAGGGNDTVRIHVDGPGSEIVSSAANVVTVQAGGGNDLVESYSSASEWSAGLGENHLFGGTGNDTLTGTADGLGDFGTATNEAEGGAGNDQISLTALCGANGSAVVTNTASGGAGEDTIKVTGDAGSEDYGGPSQGTNQASGGEGDDIVTARLTFRGASTFDDRASVNEVSGGDGADRLSATLIFKDAEQEGTSSSFVATNVVEGGDGADRLSGVIRSSGDIGDGGDLHSELYGGDGADRLSARGGEGNILNGGTGADTLLGGAGADTLIGLGGDDYLRGRGGDDVFLFGAIRNGERDRIVDFISGEDRIDLSQIDANVNRGGNQSFGFGTREGTGRVWIEQSSGSSSLLHADTGGRELIVVLQDGSDIGPGDYHARDFLL